jgi:hypothetical protein
MVLFDPFDAPSGIWSYQNGYDWPSGPTYSDGRLIVYPPNDSHGRYVSTFALSGSLFTIDVSGDRSWYTPSTYNGELARAWLGCYHAGSANQWIDDPGQYGKSHKLWLGIPASRFSYFNGYTHYIFDLNEIFNWQNNQAGDNYGFRVKFDRIGDTINAYLHNGSEFILFRQFEIEKPEELLYFEFVAGDGSLSASSRTRYGYFDLNGGDPCSSGIDLYLSGSAGVSGDIGLVIFGFEELPSSECPILDPYAAIQISDELISIYQGRIDALINQLGKNMYLEFEPTRSACPNCTYDSLNNRSTGIYKTGGPTPFARGHKCPHCKGAGLITDSVTRCIKALVKWNPKDYRKYGVAVHDPSAIVRTKSFLTEAPLIVKAKTALMNVAISDMLTLRVRRLRGPIPVGLREDRYCITFWELVDNG